MSSGSLRQRGSATGNGSHPRFASPETSGAPPTRAGDGRGRVEDAGGLRAGCTALVETDHMQTWTCAKPIGQRLTRCLGNGSARAPMKDVPSRDSASGRRTEPVIRRCPNATSWPQGRSVRIGNPRDRSILVRGGKGINRDALSKGDRRGRWANRIPRRKVREMWCSDSGTPSLVNATLRWNAEAKEGDSPVAVREEGDSGSPE